MKHKLIYILLITCFLLVFTSCGGGGFSSVTDNGKLTKEKAENALNRWISEGQVAVRGIQETGGNAAQADVTFTDFHYTMKGGSNRGSTYTGAGVAVFTHYNDGRWVLTKVQIGQGFRAVWWNDLNVEVY